VCTVGSNSLPGQSTETCKKKGLLLLLVLLPVLLLNSMLHHNLEQCMHWHSAACGLKVLLETITRYTDTEAFLVTNLEKGFPCHCRKDFLEKGISLKKGLS
jgi:hypothetical protein